MIASVLIPFSILIAAGEFLRTSFASPIQSSTWTAAIEQIAQPFPQTPSAAITAFYDKGPIVAAALLIRYYCSFVWSGYADSSPS